MVSGENRLMGTWDAQWDECIMRGISLLQSVHIFPFGLEVLSLSLFKLPLHKTHPENLPDLHLYAPFQMVCLYGPKNPEQNSALPLIT